MTALRAFAELNERGDKIAVHFKYSPEAVEAIRAVPGRNFQGKVTPKHWTVPLTLDAARRLREEFGQGLVLGDALKAWGREAARAERNLKSVAEADDAELSRVPPEQAAWLRPYQRADVKMMALTNVLNANQPGVGKTVEVIYAVAEAGLKGPHLVVCPTTLFKDPWLQELEAHAPGSLVLWGATPDERRRRIEWLADQIADGKDHSNTWLLLNPEQVRVKKWEASEVDLLMGTPAGKQLTKAKLSADHKGNIYVPRDALDPEPGPDTALFGIDWGALVADEFHKFGLGEDRNTLFARGLRALRKNAARAFALSGTPMGGKTIRLWGVLNFIEPDKFASKWKWAEQWLEIDDDGWGKKIGELQPGREDEFYRAHAAHMVRRTRAEALPGLPPKVVLDVWTPMTKKQAKQYDEFERAAEVEVEGGRISATIQLAEYARLKQIANGLCHINEAREVTPDPRESGKVPVLLDRLDTYGVRGKDPEPNARAIVASESQRFVAALEPFLREQGLNVKRLDGSVKGAARDAVIDWYKEDSDDARTLVMTTQTGGVGLNLGMTDVICILDESWNPDDQEQLEDRGMRNRTTPLNVLYLRSEGTIQEDIADVTAGKRITNKNVVDIREAIRRRRGGN